MDTDIITTVHREYSNRMGWGYKPVHKNSFGFACYEASIMQCQNNPTPEKIQQGWCNAYKFWCDYKPWEDGERMPFTPLGDPERESLLTTPYSKLPFKVKYQNQVLCDILRSLLAKVNRQQPF